MGGFYYVLVTFCSDSGHLIFPSSLPSAFLYIYIYIKSLLLRGTIQPLIIFSPEVTEGAVHFTARLDGPTSDFYMGLASLA